MHRNISLDVLKLFMAFMVVGLHAEFLSEYSSLGSYLSVNGLFRIAVPVFLVINGFYFYPVLARNFQIDWLKRVFVLYVFWMLFYSYFWFSVPNLSFTVIAKLVRNIVIGYHHLWYLSGMLGAAVLLLIFKRLSSFLFISTVLVSATIGIAIQYLGNYHYFESSILDKLFNINWFHRNALLFSYPFFCIGYLINKHSIHERLSLTRAVVITAIGSILLLFESSFNFYQKNREGGFDNYLSLLFLCPFIFILFAKIDIKGKSKNIALYSSAIFFIHSFILSMLRKFSDLEPTMLTFSCILFSIVASYFIIEANKRVRFIL
ncbi:acyltransferase [Aestuariibacter sp. A3R04]|nr:acyltransferase [Aestuariibacter sp. A3R04]